MEDFHRGQGRGGRASRCKSCACAATKEWRESNPERAREAGSRWRNANPDRCRENRRAWKAANPDRVKKSNRASRVKNRERNNRTAAAYLRRRRREDPKFNIQSRLRGRLNRALKGEVKPASVMDLVGCSIEKLYAWIEMHFAEGMTWENRDRWHIDHIRPVSSFDDPADPACWHWSNLQPLWAKDNLSKGSEWTN